MPATILSAILGSTITVLALASFAVNCCVLFLLLKGKFVSQLTSSFFILSTFNILGSTIFALTFAFYLGPSSIAQDYLVSYEAAKAIGYVASSMWTQNIAMQVLVAVNRMLVIVYPKTIQFFTFWNTTFLSLFLYVFGFFLAAVGAYLLPCCPLILYHKAFAQSFIGDSYNINGMIMYLAYNIICTIIVICCYLYLYFYVKATNIKTNNFISKTSQQKRKAQEQSYAFQFSFCSFWFILTWITLRSLPFILKTRDSPIYMLATVFILCHTTSNSFVLLVFNKEVKEQFCILILRQKKITTTTQVTVVVTTSVVKKTATLKEDGEVGTLIESTLNISIQFL